MSHSGNTPSPRPRFLTDAEWHARHGEPPCEPIDLSEDHDDIVATAAIIIAVFLAVAAIALLRGGGW